MYRNDRCKISSNIKLYKKNDAKTIIKFENMKCFACRRETCIKQTLEFNSNISVCKCVSCLKCIFEKNIKSLK